MKMSEIRNTNRTGIYVQKSAGVTTAGDGLASQRDKSPVARNRENKFNKYKSRNTYPQTIGYHRDNYKSFHKYPKKSFSRPPQEIRRGGASSINEPYFISPAIKAGARESDSPYSKEFRKTKGDNVKKSLQQPQFHLYEDARRIMGLEGPHRRSSPGPPASTNFQIEVFIPDKSHPFLEIAKLNQSLLLSALETTIQDENAKSSGLIKIGSCQYKKNILNICCKDQKTVMFLKDKIPLYNRLWPGADLYVAKKITFPKRHRILVNLPNYDITSEEFFKVIGKQNNFPSKHWSLMHKMQSNRGFRALIGVDPASYERLQESDGYIHFFFERVRLQLDA